MSQFPGLALKSYIEDFYLISLTKDQLDHLCGIWNPIKEEIEVGLDMYDQEHGWRDYNYSVMVGRVTDEIMFKSNEYLGLPND